MNNLTTLTIFAILKATVLGVFILDVAIIRITTCTNLALMTTLMV